MLPLLQKLKREIAKYDKPENRLNYQKFFKEKLEDPVRIKTAILRKISNNIFKEIKGKPAAEILDICDELLRSGERYMRFFASRISRDSNAGSRITWTIGEPAITSAVSPASF
jgi:hypothetical protein